MVKFDGEIQPDGQLLVNVTGLLLTVESWMKLNEFILNVKPTRPVGSHVLRVTGPGTRSDEKVMAIKALREVTNTTLVETKNAVEATFGSYGASVTPYECQLYAGATDNLIDNLLEFFALVEVDGRKWSKGEKLVWG